MRIVNTSVPQQMFTIIALNRLFINRTGITKLELKTNFARKVAMVDSQISAFVDLSPDSTDMCIPSASEKESAIAIVRIPPNTASFELVPASNPIINPIVVMIPEVTPKQIPILCECFMF